MKQRFKHKILGREEGNVTVSFVVLSFILIAVCALVVDLGGAFIAKNEQANLTQIAHEEKMSPAVTIQIKNDLNPGEKIASLLSESLRENGYDGEIKIYFYEAPESQTGASDRIYVYAVETSTTWHSIFGGIVGQADIPINSIYVNSANPYAEYRTWRPTDEVGNSGYIQSGCWTVSAGQPFNPNNCQSLSLEQMPDILQSELAKSIDKLGE